MSLDQVEQATFAREWSEWHEERERRLSDPHGFLAATALHWLTSEPTRFDDVPGEWSSENETVRVALAPGEALSVDGVTVEGVHDFELVNDDVNIRATFNDAVVEVTKRGGRSVIRPRHPEHELLKGYRGTPTYPLDSRWRVTGRFIPFAEPRRAIVDSAVEGMTQSFEAPGQVEFEIGTTSCRLTVFDDGDEFTILFKDATSGLTTYAATRELTVESPDQLGHVILDFNRAMNPPCAYTDFATCPLAPPENSLPVKIEAGEKIPLGP